VGVCQQKNKKERIMLRDFEKVLKKNTTLYFDGEEDVSKGYSVWIDYSELWKEKEKMKHIGNVLLNLTNRKSNLFNVYSGVGLVDFRTIYNTNKMELIVNIEREDIEDFIENIFTICFTRDKECKCVNFAEIQSISEIEIITLTIYNEDKQVHVIHKEV
jgi:hypothetical protein